MDKNAICEITLYDFEVELATLLAKRKNEANRGVGAKETNFGSVKCVSSEVRDANSYAGEIGYARIRNISMDFNTAPRKGGFDFKERDGRTIDVKTRRFLKNPDLVVSNTATHSALGHCDYYVLMTGSLPSKDFYLHGWIREKDIISETMLSGEFSDGRKMERPGYVCNTSEMIKVYPSKADVVVRCACCRENTPWGDKGALCRSCEDMMCSR